MRKLVFLVMALAACATAPGAAVPSAAPDLLYVCNQSDATVTLIDTQTNEIVGLVDLTQLGFSKNAKPHHIAVEPDGSYWYVTLIGENKIVKLDRNNKVVGTATFEVPGMLALHPTQDLLFVGRYARYKGVDTALEAFARIRNPRNVTFKIMGDEGDEDARRVKEKAATCETFAIRSVPAGEAGLGGRSARRGACASAAPAKPGARPRRPPG